MSVFKLMPFFWNTTHKNVFANEGLKLAERHLIIIICIGLFGKFVADFEGKLKRRRFKF